MGVIGVTNASTAAARHAILKSTKGEKRSLDRLAALMRNHDGAVDETQPETPGAVETIVPQDPDMEANFGLICGIREHLESKALSDFEKIVDPRNNKLWNGVTKCTVT